MIDFTKKILIVGTNVIESEEHTMLMVREICNIMKNYPEFQFVFKVSFDKANRTSISSFRGVSIEESIEIFKNIKKEYNIPILTDVHLPEQADIIKEFVDIIQIPAFLARQTDLVEAVAKTHLPIHVKKGQFMNASTMLKVYEKIRHFGNKQPVILCERGTMFGYNDLIVDTRNISRMKNNNTLVSLDMTHCLQQPGLTNSDNSVSSGGLREFVPLMSKIGIVSNIDVLFMEVHNDPSQAKCDGATQIYLKDLKNLLDKITNFWSIYQTIAY